MSDECLFQYFRHKLFAFPNFRKQFREAAFELGGETKHDRSLQVLGSRF